RPCSLVTVRTIRSSTAVGRDAGGGRLTSMPRYIIGAVSMKMSKRTSTTSTNGMMLISASEVPTLREPSASSSLNAIFDGARDLGAGRGTRQQIEDVESEAIHLGRPVLDAIDEVVVADDGGDCRAETERGGDQCLGDARRHHGEGGRPLLPDAVEGRHDAPHRSEEPDERRRAGGGGQERQEGEEARGFGGGEGKHCTRYDAQVA